MPRRTPRASFAVCSEYPERSAEPARGPPCLRLLAALARQLAVRGLAHHTVGLGLMAGAQGVSRNASAFDPGCRLVMHAGLEGAATRECSGGGAPALACKGPLNARLATGVGLSFMHSRIHSAGGARRRGAVPCRWPLRNPLRLPWLRPFTRYGPVPCLTCSTSSSELRNSWLSCCRPSPQRESCLDTWPRGRHVPSP